MKIVNNKILFVESDDRLRNLYTMYIENFVHDTIVDIVDSCESAIELLQTEVNYFLVISDYYLSDRHGGHIFEYLRKNKTNSLFLLFSHDPPEMHEEFKDFYSSNQFNHYLTKQSTPELFRQKLMSILKPTMISQKPIRAFQKIRISAFYRFNKVLCDVYLKLSDSKYYRVIGKNERYPQSKLDDFKTKGHTDLYIKNDDFLNFGVTYCRTPFLINDIDSMSEEDKEMTIEQTHKAIQETVAGFGIDKEIIELTVKNVKVITEIIKKKNNLNGLLRPMQLNPNYIYDHSYMVCIILGAICYQSKVKNLDYTTQNLCMASILHDMTLVESSIAELADLRPIKINSLGQDKKKLIQGHVHSAAKLAKSLGPTWKKVEEIILNHHETVDSKGYPKKLGLNNLTELDCMFILGHEYVIEMYKSNFKIDNQYNILKKLHHKYNKGKGQKIVEFLLKNFDEGKEILKSQKFGPPLAS